MKALSIFASIIDRIVWSVGCITIIFYAHDHWPLASQVGVIALLLVFGLWFIWKFFVRPFRAGIRGE